MRQELAPIKIGVLMSLLMQPLGFCLGALFGLAAILLETLLPGSDGSKRLASLMLGVSAFGYSTFWLLAARRTPVPGSPGAAEESLGWLAIPSTGSLVIGLLLVIWMVVRSFGSRG